MVLAMMVIVVFHAEEFSETGSKFPNLLFPIFQLANEYETRESGWGLATVMGQRVGSLMVNFSGLRRMRNPWVWSKKSKKTRHTVLSESAFMLELFPINSNAFQWPQL